MLSDKTAVATIAVKDLAAGKNFYEGTLGLTADRADDPGGVLYKTGNSNLFVYESQFGGTNKATAASFGVGDDIKEIVEGLKGKGVKFEQYDIPQVTRDGDIHIMKLPDGSELKAAWFKDPDGNIINLVNKM